MREDELALNKAIESGDTDLVYLAMLHIHKNKSPEDFFNLIRDRPLARNLFISYCRSQDRKSLKKTYLMMQRMGDAGNCAILDAYECEDWKGRMEGLEIALGLFKQDKTNEFTPVVTEEQIKLLRYEQQCEVEQPDGKFVDCSVSELIELYIKNGRAQQALKVKQQFKVPETRLWHIEVKTLAQCAAWRELEKLTLNKKVPPIGFVPFVEACVDQKQLVEAHKYIQRLPDTHEQIEWLANIGYWKEAAEVAAREKDVEALQVIKSRCRGQPQVIAFIDRVLAAQPQKN